MKFINCFYFSGLFLSSWIRIWIWIANPYGSKDPIESGCRSNPDTDADPDPQHWLARYFALSHRNVNFLCSLPSSVLDNNSHIIRRHSYSVCMARMLYTRKLFLPSCIASLSMVWLHNARLFNICSVLHSLIQCIHLFIHTSSFAEASLLVS